MIGIVERLRFDAIRCEAQFSKGVATNIEEGIAEIERLRAIPEKLRNADDATAHVDSVWAAQARAGYRQALKDVEDAINQQSQAKP